MKNMKKILALLSAITMTVSASSCAFVSDLMGKILPNSGKESSTSESSESSENTVEIENVEHIKNVILLIGDGMGPNQIKAGELFLGEKLCFQNFPYSVKVETRSNNAEVTDSAAAATAMATGTRTNNGYVALAPDESELTTIVDVANSLGKRTGVLATEPLSGATPMGFSGHSISRNNTGELLRSAAANSNVNLFASYTMSAGYLEPFIENGYTQKMKADEISDATEEKIIGSYNILATATPMSERGQTLAFDRLVTESLDYLSQDEDGFFLMAEGSHIDHGGHDNNFDYMLSELVAFNDAVKAAVDWASKRDDTVVIVTADHETGGLALERSANTENLMDSYWWTTTGHTATDVFCFINGADVDFAEYSFQSEERIKNTDIFQIIKKMLETGNV